MDIGKQFIMRHRKQSQDLRPVRILIVLVRGSGLKEEAMSEVMSWHDFWQMYCQAGICIVSGFVLIGALIVALAVSNSWISK